MTYKSFMLNPAWRPLVQRNPKEFLVPGKRLYTGSIYSPSLDRLAHMTPALWAEPSGITYMQAANQAIEDVREAAEKERIERACEKRRREECDFEAAERLEGARQHDRGASGPVNRGDAPRDLKVRKFSIFPKGSRRRGGSR